MSNNLDTLIEQYSNMHPKFVMVVAIDYETQTSKSYKDLPTKDKAILFANMFKMPLDDFIRMASQTMSLNMA